MTDTAWEQFELDCTEYLNGQFGEYAKFRHTGGADSTVADIQVVTRTGRTFYMDAKCCPAHCGQFVLLPDVAAGEFVYSPGNVAEINEYARQMMEYMNREFEAFKEAGTAGKELKMENGPEIFAGWIMEAYQNKGVRYFITNDYRIFPVEQFRECFDVTAKYRIKRSGSNSVGKRNIPVILEHIHGLGYTLCESREERAKLFVRSEQELHNRRFVLGKNEYMFSKRGGEYEIRRLSNTFHANVIFSITLKAADIEKAPNQGLREEEFIQVLS